MASRWLNFRWWILREYASRGIHEMHAEKCCSHWGNIGWVSLQSADVLNPCFLLHLDFEDATQTENLSTVVLSMHSVLQLKGWVMFSHENWSDLPRHGLSKLMQGLDKGTTINWWLQYLGNTSAGDLHCWLPEFGMVDNVNMNSCRIWPPHLPWKWHTWKCH